MADTEMDGEKQKDKITNRKEMQRIAAMLFEKNC